jgi:hypothetical protein
MGTHFHKSKLAITGRDGLAYALAVPLVFALDWACPFLALTGLPCPGCGITRASMALLELDFLKAFGLNQLFFIAPLVLVSIYFSMRRAKFRNATLVAVAALMVVAFVLYRWANLDSWPGLSI